MPADAPLRFFRRATALCACERDSGTRGVIVRLPQSKNWRCWD